MQMKKINYERAHTHSEREKYLYGREKVCELNCKRKKNKNEKQKQKQNQQNKECFKVMISCFAY